MNKHPYILAGALALALAFSPAGFAQVCFTDAPVPGYALGQKHTDIAVADMTGDGFPDLVTADYEANTVSIMRWDSVGVNGQPFYIPAFSYFMGAGSGPIRLVLEDFDQDGDTDIAVICYDADKVAVLLNNGMGGMTTTFYLTGDRPADIACANINPDNFPDLVIVNEGSQSITRLTGGPGGQFTSQFALSLGAGYSPLALVAGDFNGAGGTDILVTLRNPNGRGCYKFLPGDGMGGFDMQQPEVQVTINDMSTGILQGYMLVSDIDTADFNNDGVTDFALHFVRSNDYNPRVCVVQGVKNGFPNSGGMKISFPGTTSRSTDLVCADFNCDGNADIAVAFSPNNVWLADSIKIIPGRGDGYFGAVKTIGAHNSAALALAVHDFNNDGKQDIVTANYVTPNGSTSFDIYLLLNKTNCITVTGDSTYCQAGQVTLTASSGGAYLYNWSFGCSADTCNFTPTVLNNYFSVTITDSFLCTSSYYGNIVMAPVNAGVQLAGDSLTASPAGLSYQWLDCASDTPIPGATARVFYPVIAGNYRVIVTNPYGCADTSACSFLPLSIGPDGADGADFRLYPNPAQDVFYIDAQGASRVVIHDLTGRAVHELAVKEKGSVAVRADLPPGVYVVRVAMPDGEIVQKIIIQ